MPALPKALVVEDYSEMRFMLTQMLRQAGVGQIDGVATAEDGLARLDHGGYDLAFIDVGLKQTSGLDLVRSLRGDRRHLSRGVPVLVVSGQNQLAVIAAARDAGADAFLTKPVSVAVLRQRIAQVISARRPMVDCSTYFGPDRRRGANPSYQGPERRKSDEWLL